MMQKINLLNLTLFCFVSVLSTQVYACTIGVASGRVTEDGRPILWKVRDSSEARQQLFHSDSSPYAYIGIRSEGGGLYMGLNEAGIASGNSIVNPSRLSNTNSSTQSYILRNYNHLDQIRNYFDLQTKSYSRGGRGCFPFIDSSGNAAIFELSGPEWWLEYNTIDSDRSIQGLLGIVVRANEFHQQSDGSDDISITGGRYESGTNNISGLVKENSLSVKTIIQGNEKPDSGFEFLRYGPNRSLATISRSKTISSLVVQGVLPDEDPALTTGWIILGQTNYGIAVPVWVRVSDIPQCLADGNMYDLIKSLSDKGNEAITQGSITPFELHILDTVTNMFLPYWRTNGTPSVAEMTRIEHQIANDANSLLYCLDTIQEDNKAPTISIYSNQDDLTTDFKLITNDVDGEISHISWNFGDDKTSKENNPIHTYEESGTYLVSCTVTDNDSVMITAWEYLTVPLSCNPVGYVHTNTEINGDGLSRDTSYDNLQDALSEGEN